MSIRNILTIIFAAVIFIVATVLLVVGISTHTEPGLVNSDNAWDHIPLSVRCETVGPEDRCSTAREAVDAINTRLGFEMLRWLGDTTQEEDIHLTLGVASEPGFVDPGGHFTLTGHAGVYQRCEAITSNTGTRELTYLAVYHEIGCHCLGLAHDDFDSSICRSEQQPTPSGSFPPSLTDSDRSLLREKYLR